MKKNLIAAGLGLALVIGGAYEIFSYNRDKTEEATTVPTKPKVSKTEVNKTETATTTATQQVPKISKAELDKAEKNFYKIESNVKNDDIFYYGMITIALQKLEFRGEENYRIPLTVDVKRIQFDRANLQYLKNKAVELKASEPYPRILDKWLKGDFSNFEDDYLTIRDLKGDHTEPSESPVLKVRTTEEEQKYIEHSLVRRDYK
ncbi:hypothetical protein COJ85_31530 [Bacillus sp. AFS076308]|uniref:DUF6241 domain-containing protein n=1 Tax=unclassified Bacillus (in: firmicutes) TaxID=185979 RepID=UPI000BF5DF2B|nr:MULTISPECIES: DUF6241 domain-containing protein [unclassified Bacillus (in: firmicutes)]PFN78564.1 hypothetical protein COJ85_31530 [Bacillus sp. AFS076308]PGV48058.1 hypothetical protein COD92_27795 [Bacillus sp. AFS037270]